MVFISGGNELLDANKIIKRLELKPGSQVADLGCGGAGHFVLPTAQSINPNGTAYAVDIQKVVLFSVASRARLQGIGNVKTVWSNLEMVGATKIPAESLDATYLINTLFQSKQHAKIMEEAKRLLKPEGKLLVIDWLRDTGRFGPAAENRVDPDEILEIAKKLNFSLFEKFKAGEYHFGFIFEK